MAFVGQALQLSVRRFVPLRDRAAMAHRLLEGGLETREKTLVKAQNKGLAQVEKVLFHLQAKRFDSEEAAQDALERIVRTLCYHKGEQIPSPGICIALRSSYTKLWLSK